MLVSREFLKLVIIANIIAIPISFYLLNNWLNNFASRINLSAWMFLSTTILSIMIAFFTIGFQSIKAALSNPVDSLKND
jgi:putative ABC transport system permease protein